MTSIDHIATPPLVSVVVPAYRHATYIADAILSVHTQSYREIELIVIDDHSDDNTFACAEAILQDGIAARFRGVTLLRNERNMGAHATINRGIELSRGAYIAVLNSDDLFHRERIRSMLKEMRAAGSELGFSLVKVMTDPDQRSEIDTYFRLFGPRQIVAQARDPSLGFALMRLNIAVSTGNLLFSRNVFNQVGPFQPMRYCHDWDFILQALFVTEPVLIEQELYSYRLHSGNSFRTLSHIAPFEIEAVLRRFFRRGFWGQSPNALFPCAANWPGVFELYARQCGYGRFMRLEDCGLRNNAPLWSSTLGLAGRGAF